MKYINNIININESFKLKHNVNDVSQFDDNIDQTNVDDHSNIQKGAHAYGSIRQDDPHIFTKTSFQPTEKRIADPYYLYISTCSKYTNSNPFFPRVYNITTEKDKSQKRKRSYDIETLINYEKISPENLLQVCKTVDNNLYQLAKKHSNNSKKIAVEITEFLNNLVENNQKTTNPNLSQAVKLIQRVKKLSSKFTYDIHINNFMFRGTPYGYQLVITDPLSIANSFNFW